LAAALLLSCLFMRPAAAQEYISPASIAGAETIDAERLIELVSNRPGIVVIDSRIREDRSEGFIEGSINLVDRETDCDSLAGVLADRRSPVIFYCNGVKCDRSDAATRVAVQCGYTEVYWFRGGTEEWRNKRYPLVQ
jgi:rhodanese-related sulfurtransferase